MLETHRVDLRILDAAAKIRGGGTVAEIRDQMSDHPDGPVSIDSIKRHLPGLVVLGAIHGRKEFRSEKLVTVWVNTRVEEKRKAAHAQEKHHKIAECV